MSERFYAWLLRFYPASFREAHRDDLLQLFRDRYRDESGLLQRVRLWFDVTLDFATTVSRMHGQRRAVVAGSAGTTMFLPLPSEPLRPAAMVSALAVGLVAYSLVGLALSHTGNRRGFAPGAGQPQASRFQPGQSQSGQSQLDQSQPDQSQPDQSQPDQYQRDLAEAYPSQAAANTVQPVPDRNEAAEAGSRSGAVYSGVLGQSTGVSRRFNREHQIVLDAVVANLKQHYHDTVVAQQLGDDLVMRFRRGDDAGATDQEFAALLTAQLRNASGDASLRVAYTVPAHPQSPATAPGNDCSFSKARMLPGHIGLLRLEHVLSPSDCGAAASEALSSLSHPPDALVIDFRDTHDGSSEGLSFISSDFLIRSVTRANPGAKDSHSLRDTVPLEAGRLVKVPVYILSSSSTVSAVDPFTHDLKLSQYAGSISAGKPGETEIDVWHSIDDRYAISVPEGPALNAGSRDDLQSARIRSGIRVPASEALDMAIGFARARIHVQKKPLRGR